MDMRELLEQMLKAGASDLLLVVDTPITFRIAGLLEFEKKALKAQEIGDLLLPLLSPPQKNRLDQERQLDFSYEISSGDRFRINLHYQRGTLAAAIRSIPKTISSLEELNLPLVIEELSDLQNGLLIVTGPTGCGKTTTQACMLELINQKRSAHIITIEDPVEYIHENKKSIIEHREIGTDAIDFAGALKSALRQNPDVILIGEMRDLETTATAVTAAETGHLVISTLHTANAVNAVDRIIDFFPSHQQNQIRIQLSLTLQAVIAQQLIPRSDKKELVPAAEILKGIPSIRNLIRKAQTHEIPSLMEVGKKYGMQTMEDALTTLCKKGYITLDQALSKVADPESFKKRIAQERR